MRYVEGLVFVRNTGGKQLRLHVSRFVASARRDRLAVLLRCTPDQGALRHGAHRDFPSFCRSLPLIGSLHNHRDCACGPCEANILANGNQYYSCDALYEMNDDYTCEYLESIGGDCGGCECTGDGTQTPTLPPTPEPSITYRPTPKPTAAPSAEPTPEKLVCYLLTMEDSAGSGWGDGEWQWLSNGEVEEEGTLGSNGYDGNGDGSYADTLLCTFSGPFCYELVVTTTQSTSSYYLQVLKYAPLPPPPPWHRSFT